MGTSPVYISATGTVALRGEVGAVVLTAGGATATLTLRYGGASGTVFLVLSAVANTSVSVRFGGMDLSDIHGTLTGSGASATVEV